MLFDYKNFFGQLERGLERKGQKIRHWLQDELQWGESKIQRRLTGVAPPTLDEIIEIFNKAPEQALLSFELFEKLQTLLVEQTSFSTEGEFLDYFNRLESVFKLYATEEGATLHYAAVDLPLFLFTRSKPLLEFKFALWTNSIYNGIIAELSPETFLKARKVTELYMNLPGKETWYHRAIDQQHEQLQALYQQGYLTAHQHLALAKDLHAALSEHLTWIERGEKSEGIYHKVSVAPYFTLGNGAALLSDHSKLIWSALWNAQVISSNSENMTKRFMDEWTYHRQISTYLTGASPAVLSKWRAKIDLLLDTDAPSTFPF